MTHAALGVFERHSPANSLLHFRLVAWDATRRARLLGHRLFELIEELHATLCALAALVADQTALSALAETFVFTVVVLFEMSVVVERRGRLGLRAAFLGRLGRVQLGVDDFAIEPEHGQFGTRPFLFLIQVVTAYAIEREGLRGLIHFFFVEVADEALRVSGRALFDALGEWDAADRDRLWVLNMAG